MTTTTTTTSDAMSCVNEPEDVMPMLARNFYKNVQHYQKDVCIDLDQQSAIFLCTTQYQRQTIKWMTDREKYNRAVKSDGKPFTGGLLADEMYVGKIVEVLGCVVENPANYKFHQEKVVSATGDQFALSLTSPSTRKTYKDVSKRRAIGDVSRVAIVKRPSVIETPTNGTSMVIGNDCRLVNDKFQCNATLIVVPHSTLDEWTDKTIMEKLGLKSLVYRGIYYDGYVQPHFFNDYDVVVTSYNYLQMDVNYTKYVELYDETARSRLRHARKYKYSRSPLKLIKWWRICFDCNQEINCYVCNKSEIIACLESVHKWIINGTPIRTSLDNLFCIIKFLDIKPYCDHNEFLVLIKGEQNHMYSWFANVIKHNSIDDINIELNIPKITNEQHWLKYSTVENRFYPNRYNSNVKKICVNATKPCQRLNTPLKYVNWKKLSPIMIPIVRLQKECIHPQYNRGDFKKIKKLSVNGIRDEIISAHHNNVTKLLRCVLLQHNIMAGYYFSESPSRALIEYIAVVNLSNKYRRDISDIHQTLILHALNNILVLMIKNGVSNQVISNHSFTNQFRKHKDEYLRTFNVENIENIRRNNEIRTHRIDLLMMGELFTTDWYSNMFELIVIPRHFFYELQLELADYCASGVKNIAKKLETKQDICKILQKWLSELENRRHRVFNLFEELKKLSIKELFDSSYKCCVKSKNIFTRFPQLSIPKCQLCNTETGLKEYEVVLFNYSYVGATEKSIWTNTYEKSQEELLLSKLFKYGKSIITDSTWLINATKHMNALSLLRTEFEGMQTLWSQLNKTNYRFSSVQMSKPRIKIGMDMYLLRDIVEPKTRLYGQNVDAGIDMKIVDRCLRVRNNRMQLHTEIVNCRKHLSDEINSIELLEKVKNKNMNENQNRTVSSCVYSMCLNCMKKLTILDNSRNTICVTCPFCNVPYVISESTIFFTENLETTQVSDITFKGNFSIKIESITLKLMELIAENPTVKILIFSFWDKALDLLGETLKVNVVNYRTLKRDSNFQATLNEFKTDSTINALLMTLNLTSKEFSLTEATRIFFMEPIINKTYEINAIGKIRRIGQTKPTFVHHFIIRDTIEEKITNVFSKRSLDDWGDVTLSELATVLTE